LPFCCPGLTVAGTAAALIMAVLGCYTLVTQLPQLFRSWPPDLLTS
jgi:hypothetical protein